MRYAFFILILLAGCQNTPLQVSEYAYKSVTTLQDAVIVEHSDCINRGRNDCDAVAYERTLLVGQTLDAVNQYDDLRKAGLFDEAEDVMLGVRLKTRILRSALIPYLDDAELNDLEWLDGP